MKRAALAIAALAALAGAGCGHDDAPDPAIGATVDTYVRAVTSGDMVRACGVLAPAAQEDVFSVYPFGFGQGPATECRLAFEWLARIASLDKALSGVMDLKRAQHAGETARAREVTQHGDTATVRVDGSHKVIRLQRSGDRWLIARLDTSDMRR